MQVLHILCAARNGMETSTVDDRPDSFSLALLVANQQHTSSSTTVSTERGEKQWNRPRMAKV
jgi:hypothetical protein